MYVVIAFTLLRKVALDHSLFEQHWLYACDPERQRLRVLLPAIRYTSIVWMRDPAVRPGIIIHPWSRCAGGGDEVEWVQPRRPWPDYGSLGVRGGMQKLGAWAGRFRVDGLSMVIRYLKY